MSKNDLKQICVNIFVILCIYFTWTYNWTVKLKLFSFNCWNHLHLRIFCVFFVCRLFRFCRNGCLAEWKQIHNSNKTFGVITLSFVLHIWTQGGSSALYSGHIHLRVISFLTWSSVYSSNSAQNTPKHFWYPGIQINHVLVWCLELIFIELWSSIPNLLQMTKEKSKSEFWDLVKHYYSTRYRWEEILVTSGGAFDYWKRQYNKR